MKPPAPVTSVSPLVIAPIITAGSFGDAFESGESGHLALRCDSVGVLGLRGDHNSPALEDPRRVVNQPLHVQREGLD